MIRPFHLSHPTIPIPDGQVENILATAHRTISRTGVTSVLIHTEVCLLSSWKCPTKPYFTCM